ncbi:hypothetical protein UPYG_G00214720 [Umbra pygmaea]|uniref:Uncharacterized protein n=1 Tax=Umbra pygmaea TaxID=75934 RepID=A0ABD0X6R3_UMBPY
MLSGLSHATEMENICNANQISSQCSATLGGTLDHKLMNNASGYELRLRKNLTQGPEMIFTMKRNKVSTKGPTEGRSEFFINNGTFRLTNAEMADSGQYFLEVYNSKGTSIETRQIQLNIKEVENICIATQISSQCSVTLGGTLNLKLMNNASGYELRLRKNLTQGPEMIFTMKRNKVSTKGPTEGRSEFFINNGTFRLTDAEMADFGQYFLEVYNSNGTSIETRKIQLNFKALSNPGPSLPRVLIMGSAGGVLLLVMLVMLVICCIIRRRTRPGPQMQNLKVLQKEEEEDKNCGNV